MNDPEYKMGGELKWAVNPHSVLDLTVNTDFAQADVDRQVNNLSRFTVFFPERRQFFLENASLFNLSGSPRTDGTGGLMRIHPFFSRRIGLDDKGNPIPIDAGARYVNYSAKHNYGVIAMRQREMGDSPLSNFIVGRIAENFGKQNRIGGLFAIKNTKEDTHLTSTLDGFFRLGQPHAVNTMLVHALSGEYEYTRHQLIASADPSKMLNVIADLSWGDYFNGKLQSYDFAVQFVPIPHISLQAKFNRNYLEEVGDALTTEIIDLYSLEGRFALNPHIQLVGFYQQNSEYNSINFNIRFSWEYQPLSFIYVVINKQSFNSTLQVPQVEDHIIAKINFLKQF